MMEGLYCVNRGGVVLCMCRGGRLTGGFVCVVVVVGSAEQSTSVLVGA